MEEKTLSYDGCSIFYRVYGKGKPLMLVHGFAEDGDIWKEQVEYLEDKCRLIVPDLPGSGKSDPVHDMSMEGMADVLKAVLDHAIPEVAPSIPPKGGSGGVTIIGHSMGGYILLAFADKYGPLLQAMGLFHSSAYADSEEKKANRRKGIGFIKEHGAGEFLKTMIPNLFSDHSKERIPGVIAELIDRGNNFAPSALVSYYDAMMQRPDRTAVLKKTAVPVMFIMGKYDNAVPMTDSLEQCHLPGIAYIHVLQESGHMGMREEAEKSNRILEKFLLES